MNETLSAARPPGPSRRLVYGRSVLVILGWYATIVAAAVIGPTTLPSQPRSTDCSGFGSCWSDAQGIAFVLILVGLPAFLIAMTVALLVLAGLVRGLRSATLAGTIAALTPLGLTAVVLLIAAGNHR